MSKKKSYMNKSNILMESFFDDLIRSIIPKSIQKKVNQDAIKSLKNKIEKSNDKIKDYEKRSKEISDRIAKALEKQYGYKTDKKKVSDFIGKRK